jgi:hypothetical protein
MITMESIRGVDPASFGMALDTGDRCGWPVLVRAIRSVEVEVIGDDGKPTTAIYTEDCLLAVDDPDAGVR